MGLKELAAIVAAIEGACVPLSSEAAAQAELERVLRRVGDGAPVVRREWVIDAASRIDFVVEWPEGTRIGVEVKIGSARRADIQRQMARYARSGRFAGLVLATNRAVRLPAEIWGLPIGVASLGRGWL